ncbi:hypothetical protein H7I42_17665 [Mycolicibacterium vanbaalenii PYR-1]|nr:hypothetical protein [Mycolicibacterium vanbaalenii PYR-1]PQP48832.1 hypothetical protein C6A88_13150 [Mycolicibacterium austroafricanum]
MSAVRPPKVKQGTDDDTAVVGNRGIVTKDGGITLVVATALAPIFAAGGDIALIGQVCANWFASTGGIRTVETN